MVFVTIGSQPQDFSRLLNEVSKLVDDGSIQDEVYMQIGLSNFQSNSNSISCTSFLSQKEMNMMMKNASYVITHGGVGSILLALKYEKKVIAVPRLKKFREHMNDHQLDIIERFAEKKLLVGICNISNLKEAVLNIGNFCPDKYVSTHENIVNDINKKLQILLQQK